MVNFLCAWEFPTAFLWKCYRNTLATQCPGGNSTISNRMFWFFFFYRDISCHYTLWRLPVLVNTKPCFLIGFLKWFRNVLPSCIQLDVLFLLSKKSGSFLWLQHKHRIKNVLLGFVLQIKTTWSRWCVSWCNLKIQVVFSVRGENFPTRRMD